VATLSFGQGSRTVRTSGWLETFRAADAWVVAAWGAAAAMAPGTSELSRQLRRGALECGASLVAATQCEKAGEKQGYIERARARLMEARYLLYLSRRFGAIDSRRYKTLSVQLNRALREVRARASP